MDAALGHPDEMTGLVGGDGHCQSLGVRQPHVLAGKTGYPPGNVEGILPASSILASQ